MADDQTKNAVTDTATRLQRVSATQVDKQSSDANAGSPKIEYDPATKQRFYDTAPTQLLRLMSSPLVKRGPFAKGPAAERLLFAGWSTGHMALDFACTDGESVMATADGKVVFVGYQSTDEGSVEVNKIRANAVGVLSDADGNTVAQLPQVGFAGIYITIRHSGDFGQYSTTYARLSQANVVKDQVVKEGDVVGSAGGTGGPTGFSTSNLYLLFQAFFVNSKLTTAVPATSLVPNVWPGHQDSTNTLGLGTIISPIVAAMGIQVMHGQAAVLINALNRATTMQNQTTADIKQGHSEFATRTAQNLNVAITALYAAANAFNGTAPVVTTPMTFDFTAGVWNPDQDPV